MRRMDAGVGCMMIGFLEYLIGSNPGSFDDSKAFHIHRRCIDIDAAYFAGTIPGAVDRAHLFGNKLRVIAGMLAEDQDEALLTGSLQSQDLFAQFPWSQRLAHREFVAALKTAIGAVVHTIIAHIEGSKEHNPIAVDGFLERLGRMKNLFEQLRLVRTEKHGRFLDRERLFCQALGDDVLDLLFLWLRTAEQLR